MGGKVTTTHGGRAAVEKRVVAPKVRTPASSKSTSMWSGLNLITFGLCSVALYIAYTNPLVLMGGSFDAMAPRHTSSHTQSNMFEQFNTTPHDDEGPPIFERMQASNIKVTGSIDAPVLTVTVQTTTLPNDTPTCRLGAESTVFLLDLEIVRLLKGPLETTTIVLKPTQNATTHNWVFDAIFESALGGTEGALADVFLEWL
jgi:hypothetical protein